MTFLERSGLFGLARTCADSTPLTCLGVCVWCRSNSNLPATSPVLTRANANAGSMAAQMQVSDLDYVDPDLELVTPPPVPKTRKRKTSSKPRKGKKGKGKGGKKLVFSSDSEVGLCGPLVHTVSASSSGCSYPTSLVVICAVW